MLQVLTPAPVAEQLPAAQVDAQDVPRDLHHVFRYQWPLIAVCAIGALAVGAAVILASRPVYQANASVLFDPLREGNVRAGDSSLGDLMSGSIDSARLESQIQILRSEQVYRPVMEAHRLDRDSELATPKSPMLGALIGLVKGMLRPEADTGGQGSPLATMDNFEDRLSVSRLGQSYVLQIGFRSEDPEKAARLANAATASYIQTQLAPRLAAAERDAQFEPVIRRLRDNQATVSSAIETGQIDITTFPVSEARVISAAQVPVAPSQPRRGITLAFSLVAGLVLGVFLGFMRQTISRRIRDRHDVEVVLGTPLLGTLPRSGANDIGDALALDHAPRRVGHNVRDIRTMLETMPAREDDHWCVGVTCWRMGRLDSSRLSYLLALSFACAGRRTLLVDANALHPTLSERMPSRRVIARPDGAGLTDALLGEDADDVIVATDAPGLFFMPIGQSDGPLQLSDWVTQPAAQAMFRSIRQRFERIVINLPPVAASVDTRAFSPLVDAYVIGLGRGYARETEARRLLTALRRTNTAIAGVVLA